MRGGLWGAEDGLTGAGGCGDEGSRKARNGGGGAEGV